MKITSQKRFFKKTKKLQSKNIKVKNYALINKFTLYTKIVGFFRTLKKDGGKAKASR